MFTPHLNVEVGEYSNVFSVLHSTKQYILTHRVGSKDLEAGFVGLEQLSHHLQETLHKQVDALTVAGHQQLVQGFHCYAHIPEEEGEKDTEASG